MSEKIVLQGSFEISVEKAGQAVRLTAVFIHDGKPFAEIGSFVIAPGSGDVLTLKNVAMSQGLADVLALAAAMEVRLEDELQHQMTQLTDAGRNRLLKALGL